MMTNIIKLSIKVDKCKVINRDSKVFKNDESAKNLFSLALKNIKCRDATESYCK